ncbi:MAG: hypothetical protein H0X30_13835 [Anaerolineae bacterium]|nr:hypothetical protein [Anaerolineae bacterium]
MLASNMTENEKIDRSLIEMPETYRLLAQNLPNTSIVIFDHDMRYTLAEGSIVKRLLPNDESIVGKRPDEILEAI